jgi:hypothetical protein
MKKMNKKRDRLLTIEEVAEWLSIPKQKLHGISWLRLNLPHIKKGNFIRFRESDIKKILKKWLVHKATYSNKYHPPKPERKITKEEVFEITEAYPRLMKKIIRELKEESLLEEK